MTFLCLRKEFNSKANESQSSDIIELMNLFIDTNIYLTFYDFSKDDIEELRKLEVAIKAKKINLLFLNKQ